MFCVASARYSEADAIVCGDGAGDGRIGCWVWPGPPRLAPETAFTFAGEIQSKLIAMLFVTSAVVSAVLGFIGYESRRASA
jgi:hypothetical protein